MKGRKSMARISCEVYNCNYNCDGGCRLGTIKVEGSDAETSRDTVCDSYSDDNEKGCVNCTPASCACNNSEIECHAVKCKYNSNLLCTADRITVGNEDATTHSETQCRTFEEK